MKNLVIVLILVGICSAYADANVHPVSDYSGKGIIAMVGDMRSVLGTAGKNICVSGDGNGISIMYGSPSDPFDPNNPFGGIAAAYSTNQGETWGGYGPFNTTSPLSLIYPGVDGAPNFSQNLEELYSVWQENLNGIYVMNWGTGISAQLSEDCFMPCVGVDPDDPLHVMVTARHLNNGGNLAWISTDGGYTWSDSVELTESGDSGHFRWGTNDYAFFTYHDDYMSDEYPYYVETTDGGATWSSPATLPAITSGNFWWSEFDCEVINNHPFAVHNDLDSVMQLFYPDPDNPGNPGSWNWTELDVDAVGGGAFTYQDTTWTTTIVQFPSIAYDPDLDVILVTYKANYEISPPPPGWTDGNYLGGIVSADRGRTWYPTRPISGPLLQVAGGPTETAHRLVTINDTTYCYTTWTDADYGIMGNQYFELGTVLPIDLDYWNSGVEENDRDTNGSPLVNLTVFPTVATNACIVSFNMQKQGKGSLKLFDATGRLVKTIFTGHLNSGRHNFDITTSGLPNGVYLLVLESEITRATAKVIKMH